VDGQVLNSLFVVGEKKLVYVAGANVVVYNMNELDNGTMQFIPGEENNEGINHISLSENKSLMAICQRGEARALCTIYDFNDAKKIAFLPDRNYF
jgi:hypothetical protein